jgi:hypothetical protein
MKAIYDNQPEVLGALGNGAYRYRWNISEVEIEIGNDEVAKKWQCEEVTVWPTLTANKITKAVISEIWPSDYEQKLVNEYNAAQLGVYDEVTASKKVEQYRAFLVERNRIKAQVDKDCEALGIR